MEKNERKWVLELTEEQFNCITIGMEFYHRMLCGQVSELNNLVPHRINADTMGEVKRQLFPELRFGESYGWNGGHENKYVDVMQAQSYQIYREMKHQNAIDKGCNNVYSSPTLQTGKAKSIIVKKINCKEE